MFEALKNGRKLMVFVIGLLVGGAVMSLMLSTGSEGVGAPLRIFTSSQVGSSPADGFVLQTNGAISTWVATSTLGLGGGGGASFGQTWDINSSGQLAPTTTIEVLLNNGFLSIASSTLTASTTFSSEIDYTPPGSIPKIIQYTLLDTGITGNQNGAIHIDNTANLGHAMTVFSNLGVTANGPMLRYTANNAAFDKPVIEITNEGTAGSATGIRLNGPRPEIEFFETDQVLPAGAYEIRVNGDKFQLGSRNAADSGFEYPFTWFRAADGGQFGIGTSSPFSMLSITSTSTNASNLLISANDESDTQVFSVNESGDVVLSGEIGGSRMYLDWNDSTARTVDTSLKFGSVTCNSNEGVVMNRTGSIVGMGFSFESMTFSATGTHEMEVRVNDAIVYTASVSVTGDGFFEITDTQARGTDTFAVGDQICARQNFIDGTFTVDDMLGFVEIVTDN